MRRFPRVFGNTAWLAERARELPSWLFDPNLPRREHKHARNLRLSAFHSRFESAGARFGQAAGWERPNWFAPNGRDVDDPPTYKRPGWFDAVAEEHKAARETVALFERSPMAKILVEGPDAEQLLQTACANDLSGHGRPPDLHRHAQLERRVRVRPHGHAPRRRPIPRHHRPPTKESATTTT